jgi:NAD(P)-dependent dehydrogenase (short-subunit alcohol dehydrogenase family)
MKWLPIELAQAACSDVATVLSALGSARDGLTSTEALDRLRSRGPNAVRSRSARAIEVLLRQRKSPLLVLLVAGRRRRRERSADHREQGFRMARPPGARAPAAAPVRHSAALFLASDRSSFITGAVIAEDGGLVAR